MKLTAIFRGSAQVGENHYTDYAITRDIPLTEEQIKLLTAPKSMGFSELILEQTKR
jgi:hypothetical protein